MNYNTYVMLYIIFYISQTGTYINVWIIYEIY